MPWQQLQAMDQLLKKRDQVLQSTKMVVKFRDNAIAILERGQKPSDVGGFNSGFFIINTAVSQVGSIVDNLKAEIEELKKANATNPEVFVGVF
jgi:hypothetical protein